MRPTYRALNQTTHLYTKGKQFILGFDEYIGEYHIAMGKPWTGPTHTAESKKLKPYTKDKSSIVYSNIRPDSDILISYIDPYDTPVAPKKVDYDIGFFVRSFIRRYNDTNNFICEVDVNTSKFYGKPGGIDSNLHQMVQMNWYITRDKTLLNKVKLNNTKELKEANMKMPGLIDHIMDITEYSEIVI